MTQTSQSYSKCSVCGVTTLVTFGPGLHDTQVERRALSPEEETALTLMEVLDKHVCPACEAEKKRLEKERVHREKYEKVAEACLRVPASRLPRCRKSIRG